MYAKGGVGLPRGGEDFDSFGDDDGVVVDELCQHCGKDLLDEVAERGDANGASDTVVAEPFTETVS